MKKDIHPEYYPTATVICSCGATWQTGSTLPELRTDVCSNCHPFFTGEQRIVDSAGQVDRFMKRMQQFDSFKAKSVKRDKKVKKKLEERFLKQQLLALNLDEVQHQVLQDSGIITVGDLVTRIENNRDELLELKTIDESALGQIQAHIDRAREAVLSAG